MNTLDFFDRTFTKEVKRLNFPFGIFVQVLLNYTLWRVREEEEIK